MTQRRLILQSSAQSMIFDGYYGETFVIELRGSVSSINVKNVTPGRLYVFILKTNEPGGYALKWGAQILNGTDVDKMPESTSVFCFIGLAGGNLMATTLGAWTR